MYIVNFFFGILMVIILLGLTKKGLKKKLKFYQVLLAFLVCYPWQIGDDIYSVFGGRNTKGSVYSLVSIYQDSKTEDAVSVLGFGYQKAGRDAGYQSCYPVPQVEKIRSRVKARNTPPGPI